ncbi:hypothetical protein ACSFBM_00090 [Variovorax sp. GB1R11]|uniref:hypothetical protein n=1 Tax=Variovorax sp. GB1R11 TaxID=3443741 RepID=UPI003F482BD7
MPKRTAVFALTLSALAALASLPITSAWSQDKPALATSDSVEIVVGKEAGEAAVAGLRIRTAIIAAIDPSNRELTLKRSDGSDLILVAGDRVKNFNQLRIGDRVTLERGGALLVELKKVSGGIRERTDWVDVTTSLPGAKAGVMVRRRVQAVMDVVAVDRKTQLVTLRGVRETREFKIMDPKVVANLKAGERVEATLVQGEALSVKAAKAL